MRKEKGLSKKKLAELAGISQNHLSKVESGMMFCSRTVLPIFNTSNTFLIQENVKRDMLGRTFANLNILSTIYTTLGITVFGLVGDMISVDYLLVFVGICIAHLSVWVWKIYTGRY